MFSGRTRFGPWCETGPYTWQGFQHSSQQGMEQLALPKTCFSGRVSTSLENPRLTPSDREIITVGALARKTRLREGAPMRATRAAECVNLRTLCTGSSRTGMAINPTRIWIALHCYRCPWLHLGANRLSRPWLSAALLGLLPLHRAAGAGDLRGPRLVRREPLLLAGLS